MTTDDHILPPPRGAHAETGVAALGTAASLTALSSAAACCVLPLLLAGTGVGAAAFAPLVPFHWPLTILAAVAIAAGWLLYWRRRRTGRGRATFMLLCAASLFVALSAVWPSYVEQPLTRLLTGA